ncbi:MAG TPA: hypothetical protein IGS53_04635 [Leptolyngbyaceae cyanobacterium M33_DOE_097]|uniref:Uncharacterized protein n=1 Tax=Oscillatoriales cyanobacterium SpSt-418 TaxID=2282169 RepID=A0A7C3PJM1_9CYAN|nr:hypothetical protein [Leptolyngbyaceae cyanobacterium M33_DOE_097]
MYVWISLIILLLLTVAYSVLVYYASPLRDPSFQPNSGNAGSLLPWLQGIRESDWIRGATVLAGLLASNFAWLLWQLNQPQRLRLLARRPRSRTKLAIQSLFIGAYAGIGFVFFAGLWILFMGYLMVQWLVD